MDKTYVPHARGDEPFAAMMELQQVLCSPRTWGWIETIPLPHGRGSDRVALSLN